MDSSLTDLLLTSYLSEQLRTKSSYIYGWTPPSHNFSTLVDSSTHNPLLSLEKIYNHLQQNIYSSTATTNTVPSASVSTVGGDDNSSVISTIVGEDKIETDSQISITVCDEAKTVKRQFTCNRTLLIREMRYFSDYLKDEPEQLEEVDISVHCDLDIFQWLMNYVKRNSHNQLEPQLEPRIAISILISSDFLKMEKLVEKSLDYIHTHISEIIQTNCNMASIPEHLVKSLVQLFSSPYEIESIKDRKDKIRSKLFEYSLEHMLTSTLTKLIRCATCQNIMTIEDMMLLPCLEEKMFIKQNGKLFYQHKIDSKFDINQWIKDIYQRSELSWRDTYWMVW
ncbi:unnamed protein product [Didymodactylos carnosus]|uniref:SANT and BTB domain-containing protein n=1 Tax=Didymodactylos carnosus TaxID=1234261 RepID=A0A813PQ68_9BILA|nr:unnamed protein product [Didymodactylos carnosus]CAF0754466.1 unnamed protein product [Didymodactylos carnosus]CAF3519736.1 unnamed protein product [Didymodactylos carnosus]CAF3534633.1 unnamed protein product [Didymodactylos carnosus]